ncbi:hypothetical protein BDF22DRAFT_385418 [Syncephalis plumigaleata]|nr:hypothetical protein BDF22DRAFT_385418 [Syncephalis plumigaleata]
MSTTVSVEASTVSAYTSLSGVATTHTSTLTEEPIASVTCTEYSSNTTIEQGTECSMATNTATNTTTTTTTTATTVDIIQPELELPSSESSDVSLDKEEGEEDSDATSALPSIESPQLKAKLYVSQRKSLDTDDTHRSTRRHNTPRDNASLSTSGMRSLPPTLRASSSFGSLRSRPSSSTSCSLAIDTDSNGFLTYGEFLCADTRPRWHRRRLSELQLLDDALRDNKKFREPSKHRLRTRHSREMLKLRSKDIIMRHRASTIERLNALMPKKKNKKRTKAAIFNEIRLALRDHNVPLTCSLIDLISPVGLRQKHATEANAILLHALSNRMEQVVLFMLERGIPSDINAPILKYNQNNNNNQNSSNNGKKNKSFQYPSYFLYAIATGMYNVIAHMIKRANLNQVWYGLTPLMLACSRRSYDDHRVVALLLDYGADPELGILLPQLSFMSKLDRQAFQVPQPWSDDDGSHEQTLRQRRIGQWGRSSNASELGFSKASNRSSRKEHITSVATSNKANHYIYPFEIAAARGNQQSMQLILKR